MITKKHSSVRNPLARQALIGMAFRITLIIIVATSFSYWHMQDNQRDSLLKNLSNYVDLRGKAESEQFLLAERQTKMVRDEFLRRLRAIGDMDPQSEFDRIFVREADGLIRVRPELNDHLHHATAYLRHDVSLTPDLRRRFLIGWQLMDQWGPMLVNRFFSGFMNMPEQLSINFCPTSDWGRSATRDTDISIYETVWRSTIENNPMRQTFWTSVYYDPGAAAWMVSCVTPGDIEGRWVVTGGQDVEISELIKRTNANEIEQGTWNFIIDNQANLIAHPKLTEKISKAGGNLQISELGDVKLEKMAQAVLASDKDVPYASELPGQDLFLGVTRIEGPGWYFVTVYPRDQLLAQVFPTARIFLLVGFGTLLLELLIMASTLRRRIALPIAQTVLATEQISRGDFTVRLDPHRDDELGALANSVNRMAEAVGERDAALIRQFEEIKEAKLFQQEQQKRECIGTLAGGIAHDFNNILTAIIGYTDLARDRDRDDENWQKDLSQVRKASDRAKDLISQILTFSRKQEQEKKPVQISIIVKEALKLLRASIPSTVEIRQEIITTSTLVEADPTKINQVVINLCTNAYQAMPDQGGVLRVTLKDIKLESGAMNGQGRFPAGRYVLLSVSDNGCGIKEEIRAKIFDPYFTTKEVGKGSGLGLAVVHGIVVSCNGFIRVESEQGVGSTFHVYFPAIEIGTEKTEEEIKRQESLPQGDERILIVDDEAVIVDMYKATLERQGYNVSALCNSEKTLELFLKSPDRYDIIVTDQTMPHLSGLELAKKILQIRPDIPIILCTGYSNMISMEKAKDEGIKRFLMKPLSGKDLAVAVREELDKCKASGV